MRFFCMDLHISVIADFKSLGLVEVEDWTFSGHSFLFGRKRNEAKHINASTWESMTTETIAAFQVEYDQYLSSFDGFIVAHASCFAQVFEKYGKPIILINSCRIDLPYCFSRDMERRAQHIACLQRLDKAGLLFPVSNNKADQLYTFRATGIKTQHIPSLCLYTNMRYAPTRPTFLCYTGACSLDPLITQRHEIGNFSWQTIGEFRGVIHFPYEISTMSLFEQFSAGCPMFFPSKAYLQTMQLTSISAYWGDALPAEYGDLSNLSTWIELADFYGTFVSPNTHYFDSFAHLQSLLRSFVYVPETRSHEGAIAKWRDVLDQVRYKVMSTKAPAHLCYNRLPVLADVVYDTCYQGSDVAPQHRYSHRPLKKGDYVFVKTDLLDWFVSQPLTVPITLITGVSDLTPSDHATNLIFANPHIVKWIGCNLTARHPKLVKVPIGVGEPGRPNGNHDLLVSLHNSRTPWEEKSDTVCVPYHGQTHGERSLAPTLERLPFEEYMKEISRHKYVVCMRGNGLDTHRFCEILLMGSLPVVLRSGLDDMYETFPCLIVDSFDSIPSMEWNQAKYEHFLGVFWLTSAGSWGLPIRA